MLPETGENAVEQELVVGAVEDEDRRLLRDGLPVSGLGLVPQPDASIGPRASICSPSSCAEAPSSGTSRQDSSAAFCGSLGRSAGASAYVRFVTTSTVCGCSTKRSGSFSSPRRTSSRLISFATASTGTVGNWWCTVRSTRARTVPSPMPASKRLSAGGVGRTRSSSSAQRAAMTAFSLHVVTKARYFWRLS